MRSSSLRLRYPLGSIFFFFNDTATTEIYTLSLHDALPSGRELRREKIAGVSPHQVGLLVAIKYAPGVTVGELAAEERVSTAAMSKRGSRLERHGLVARPPSEADRPGVGLPRPTGGQRT